MKFYVYISDTKLDMLYPQIPRKLRSRIAAELKVDLKVVSVSLSERPQDETRYLKLRLVSEFLQRESLVGPLESDSDFIQAELPMRWGPIGVEDSPAAVFFGCVRDTVVVGLGGSMQHVVGDPGEARTGAYSSLFGLLGAILRESRETQGRALLEVTDYEVMHALHSTAIVATSMRGPEQRLEFVAKPLLRGEVEGKTVILASPVYVALAA